MRRTEGHGSDFHVQEVVRVGRAVRIVDFGFGLPSPVIERPVPPGGIHPEVRRIGIVSGIVVPHVFRKDGVGIEYHPVSVIVWQRPPAGAAHGRVFILTRLGIHHPNPAYRFEIGWAFIAQGHTGQAQADDESGHGPASARDVRLPALRGPPGTTLHVFCFRW
jgi:hypothetical protein